MEPYARLLNILFLYVNHSIPKLGNFSVVSGFYHRMARSSNRINYSVNFYGKILARTAHLSMLSCQHIICLSRSIFCGNFCYQARKFLDNKYVESHGNTKEEKKQQD